MTEKPIGHCTLEVLAVLVHVVPGEDRIPIYTAPPKREWVGLTDEQRDDIYFCAEGGATALETWREQARAIENKLKEKNT